MGLWLLRVVVRLRGDASRGAESLSAHWGLWGVGFVAGMCPRSLWGGRGSRLLWGKGPADLCARPCCIIYEQVSPLTTHFLLSWETEI